MYFAFIRPTPESNFYLYCISPAETWTELWILLKNTYGEQNIITRFRYRDEIVK